MSKLLDRPASSKLAWRCFAQFLDETSDNLISVAVCELIEQEEALPEASAPRVEVGDAVAVDAAMAPPRLLAAAPSTTPGRKRLYVNARAGEQLVRVRVKKVPPHAPVHAPS